MVRQPTNQGNAYRPKSHEHPRIAATADQAAPKSRRSLALHRPELGRAGELGTSLRCPPGRWR
jgi:hypothetical protein